ncbi:MAG: exo-beta-N-acetylmuramidase NamZ domain-containing protein [Gemmatimonadales bacterium]
MTAVRRGIERVLDGEAGHLRGASLGLIAHPASVTRGLEHASTALLSAGFRLQALFGPQHGARGEKQDNMVESAHFRDPATGLPVHSLYGDVRKPTPAMLAGLDALLFDLQDVGVRVYTFVWTMALAMEACAEAGVRFVVLDRPNPIGGVLREGPVLREGFESFVGLHPIPLRHGLTCGELARWLDAERGIGCDLEVVACDGWRRRMSWEDTGLPWVLPSPNLPTVDSCRVYPGMVLIEGTNLSEGRGTTKPFELFGAPFVDPLALERRLRETLGPGAIVRPCHFEPTFQKHASRMCGGGQIHVTDADTFRPVHTAVAILSAVKEIAPEDFRWREPPYEYETVKPPIDILWGGDGLRKGIDAGASVDDILSSAEAECAEFGRSVAPYLLYD